MCGHSRCPQALVVWSGYINRKEAPQRDWGECGLGLGLGCARKSDCAALHEGFKGCHVCASYHGATIHPKKTWSW